MKHSFTVLVAIAASLAPALRAQQLVRSVNGPAASAQFGKACLRVDDQNNDGYDDVLVGAPGFNSQRGAIYCVSGAYLAFGTGTILLWSASPSAGATGDAFGTSIAIIGNVIGSAARDFVVGAPGYGNTGAIYLVDGAAHTVFLPVTGASSGDFGTAVAAISDIDGDGRRDLAIGKPSTGSVFLLSSAGIANGGSQSSFGIAGITGAQSMGASLAGGFDINGDGFDDVVAGAPLADAPSASDAGAVLVIQPTGAGIDFASYLSTAAGERLGTSVDAADDYDGDGVIDFVVGAPNYVDSSGKEVGRAVVLSGARLVAQTPPYEIYNLIGIPGSLSLVLFDSHSGTAVRACGDLNGDGVGDILVGAPDYETSFGGERGYVAIYSGATGARLGNIIAGATHDHFGDAIAGVVGDLDGDGFDEFVFGGSLSDVGGTQSGVVKCFKLFPTAPVTYCTGKLNSLGCTPSISLSGIPSENSGLPFVITGSSFINHKNGLLFYSHAPVAAAFQGGFKCAANPIVRTPPISSGGSASGSDCSGTYSFDFNDWILNGWDPSVVTGAEVFAQWWSRDPASPSHTSLSNAVRFVINP